MLSNKEVIIQMEKLIEKMDEVVRNQKKLDSTKNAVIKIEKSENNGLKIEIKEDGIDEIVLRSLNTTDTQNTNVVEKNEDFIFKLTKNCKRNSPFEVSVGNGKKFKAGDTGSETTSCELKNSNCTMTSKLEQNAREANSSGIRSCEFKTENSNCTISSELEHNAHEANSSGIRSCEFKTENSKYTSSSELEHNAQEANSSGIRSCEFKTENSNYTISSELEIIRDGKSGIIQFKKGKQENRIDFKKHLNTGVQLVPIITLPLKMLDASRKIVLFSSIPENPITRFVYNEFLKSATYIIDLIRDTKRIPLYNECSYARGIIYIETRNDLSLNWLRAIAPVYNFSLKITDRKDITLCTAIIPNASETTPVLNRLKRQNSDIEFSQWDVFSNPPHVNDSRYYLFGIDNVSRTTLLDKKCLLYYLLDTVKVKIYDE